MNKEKIEAALTAKLLEACKNAAMVVQAESIRFTPVYTGRLRRDKEIRVDNAEKVVYLVQSPKGSDSQKYAKRQYFEPLRHAGKQDNLEPLPSLDVGRLKGKGDKYIYAYRYRRAVESGLLVKMEAPRWFERALSDTKTLARLRGVIKNSFG